MKTALSSLRAKSLSTFERLKSRAPSQLRFSRLTARIIAINLLVLLIPVFGLLWANQYQESLVAAETLSLETEGKIIAVTIASAAVFTNDAQQEQLVQSRAERLIHLLTDDSTTRVRLFRNDGSMIVDSRLLKNPNGIIEINPIEEGPRSWLSDIRSDWRLMFSPNRIGIPEVNELATQLGDHYAIVRDAYLGNPASTLEQDKFGDLVVSAAIPVRRYRDVLGVLMVSRDETGIDEAIRDIRITILQVFVIALLIMILLSFWLSGTIVKPVIALAKGADRVRRGKPHQYKIPDFSKRKDEIGELSHALRDMTESLWSRIDAIESFAADVSHEIKNPLTSIKSALETSEMIKDEKKKALLMKVALGDISRLDRLITDISNASRLDAELTRGESEVIDLRDMLKTLCESLNLTAKSGQSQLILIDETQQGPTWVRGIEGRLGQVLDNLISNARSFSPEDSHIDIRLAPDKTGYIRVYVEDYGPGIPEGKFDKVFSRFYTDRPQASFGNHSGLGLSISKQIAEAHDGDLLANNHYDKDGQILGASFALVLPLFQDL